MTRHNHSECKPFNFCVWGLLERIENGETTKEDADIVRGLLKRAGTLNDACVTIEMKFCGKWEAHSRLGPNDAKEVILPPAQYRVRYMEGGE